MTLTAKTLTLLSAATFALSFHGVSHAQSSYTGEAPAQTEVVDVTPEALKTPPAASWQGQKYAINGRDVVSFYSEDGPVKGKKKYSYEYDDTKWRFSSKENRDLFAQDPTKYIPEFGGFCPVALADNHSKIGKSTHYTVVDDKLYLNYNSDAENAFKKRPNDFLVRAQINFN